MNNFTDIEKEITKDLLKNQIRWLTKRYFQAEEQKLNKKQWLVQIQDEIKLLKGIINKI